jgi:membrane-associated phospholipid phosphatase
MISWGKITYFGDTVVMMPAAAAIIIWLVIGRAWRMAFWWSILFTVGLVLVVATKIAFIGWGIGIRSLDFTGISGHSMRATAVLPVLCYLMLQKSSPGLRALGICFGLMLGLLLGISRIAVHAHSISEAAAGCLLGGMISLGFIRISGSLQKPVLHRWLIVLSMLALLPTSYAKPAPTQRWMNGVALYLSGHDRPYSRKQWKHEYDEMYESHDGSQPVATMIDAEMDAAIVIPAWKPPVSKAGQTACKAPRLPEFQV